VGLFAVLPLWLLYEGLRLSLTPHDRNGAEALLLSTLGLLGQGTTTVLRVLFAITVLVAAVSIHRRQVPWTRVALVSGLEGMVYGLLLGPLAGALAASSAQLLASDGRLVPDLVGALGAGIFEELVFRMFLLSLLALLLHRAARAFSLPMVSGTILAVILSGLLFSLFHHLPPAREPFAVPAFLFRTMAGFLLGTLFILRGFGVCVYTHVMYDVHYYLTAPQ
jgi:membrane protease YdiL (CAAX protease family)